MSEAWLSPRRAAYRAQDALLCPSLADDAARYDSSGDDFKDFELAMRGRLLAHDGAPPLRRLPMNPRDAFESLLHLGALMRRQLLPSFRRRMGHGTAIEST